MRFLAAFILFAFFTASPSHALLNYTCSDSGVGAGGICSCSGVADCRQMRIDKVCKTGTRTCTDNECTCNWSQRTAPPVKPGIFKKPGILFAD